TPPRVVAPKPVKEPSLKNQTEVVQEKTTAETPSITISTEKKKKADLEKSLMDLKIKKANIAKMSLDYDMKELTGEITEEELKEKKKKVSAIEKDINVQIKEIENLLGR
ncbi:MAG: hypothetical protein ACTSQW_01665, partial [Promethearchaeota archaeon]